MGETDKLTLAESLRVYWLNLLAMALIPILMVSGSLTGIWWPLPFLFFGLVIFGTVIPYRLGRAPIRYLIVAGLVYFFVGGALAAGTLYLSGIRGE